jgi:hypothetical protein
MIDLAIICEGTTERKFAETVLKPHFGAFGIETVATEIGIPNVQQGGNVTFERVLCDLKLLLGEHEYVTTLLDFFCLDKGWRGLAACTSAMGSSQQAEAIEQTAIADAGSALCVPDIGQRFIPNVLMHEFEGLLFTAPSAIVKITHAVQALEKLQNVAGQFASPEDINSGAETAPSKRLIFCGANYGKVIHGTRIAQAIGLDAIRSKCPHFDAWMRKIEGLGRRS